MSVDQTSRIVLLPTTELQKRSVMSMLRRSAATVIVVGVLVLAGCPSPFGYYSAGNDVGSTVQTGDSTSATPVSTPTFQAAPAAGGASVIISGSPTENADSYVSLQCGTSDALIYYTTDGSTPNPYQASTHKYDPSQPIPVFGNGTVKTIKAIGYKALMVPSAVASVTVTVSYTTASTPAFDHSAGTYNNPFTLTITDSVPGATIWYTTDGTPPAAGSSASGSSPITVAVNNTTTVRAIATAPNYSQSTEAAATFALAPQTPSFSVASGTYASSVTVTISSGTTGASILYTTDGTVPGSGSTVTAASPVTLTVTATRTVRAVAAKTGWTNSAEASRTYAIPSATLDFQSLTYSATEALVAGGATTSTIDNSDTAKLPVGAVLVYKTNDGYIGKIVVTDNSTVNNNGLAFHAITYDLTGTSVIYDGTFSVTGTFHGDVGGVMGTTDFWLENSTSTVRYFVPENGARFLYAGISSTL